MPRPCKLTFDLLTLTVVSESCVTWAISVPIFVFLCLSVLDLGPMYATDRRQTDRRQTDVRRASSLNAPAKWRGIITIIVVYDMLGLHYEDRPVPSTCLSPALRYC